MFQFKRENKTENSSKPASNKIALKGGMYSLTVSALVLAILVAVNIMVSMLPSSATKYDISSTQLYSITSNTKVVVNALAKDVTIYWIVQSGEEDSVIENLLSKYDSLSDHIEVVKKNPDVYPTFAENYTDDTVENNSIVVECGDQYRYIAYADIYQTDVDYTTYSYSYSFDGEGQITSAIDYVVSDDLPQVYLLEGHGEAELSTDLTDQLTKANMETQSLSLLKEDAVPDDADCVIVNAPTSDISEEEKDILADYVSDGGKLLVMSGPVESGMLDNLNSLLADYNVTVNQGIVIEEDSEYYAFSRPYILLPNLTSSDITDPLIDENYYVLVPMAEGLTTGSTSKATVTELLTTSSGAYSKVDGYDITTYDKEENDIDGAFALAVDIEDNGGGEIIWIGSSDMTDTTYNAYSSGANLNFVMNAINRLAGETDAISIKSKSLSYNYLTISDSTASMLKLLMIAVLPLAFLIAGIYVTVSRRRRKNEQE